MTIGAVVKGALPLASEPFTITKGRVELTLDGTLATVTVAVPHNGPSGREPFFVALGSVNNDDGEAITGMNWTTDTTNNEVDLELYFASGTSDDEIDFDVLFWFLPAAPDAGRTGPVGYAAPTNANF